MKTKENNFRSPKNKYFADVRLLAETFAGGSNVVSYGAETLEACKRGAESYLSTVFGHLPSADVQIRENRAGFPSFDWVVVESYKIGQ